MGRFLTDFGLCQTHGRNGLPAKFLFSSIPDMLCIQQHIQVEIPTIGIVVVVVVVNCVKCLWLGLPTEIQHKNTDKMG